MHDEHFKVHKVVWKQYSGEVVNANIVLQQIYSGNHVPNFIKIAGVLQKMLHNIFWSLFSGYTVDTVLHFMFMNNEKLKVLCNPLCVGILLFRYCYFACFHDNIDHLSASCLCLCLLSQQ